MKKIATIFGVLFLFISCGPNTRISDSWSSPDAPGKALHKVLVVGLMPDKERPLREELEENLASSLANEGIRTNTAYREYGPKGFEGLSEKQVLSKLKGSGFEGVMTITLLDKTKEETYIPGNVRFYPFAIGYNRFWGYYTTYYNRVYDPGYYSVRTNYFVETNLYDIKTNKLLYSAQSETVDPSSPERFAEGYTKAIIQNMKTKNLLSGE